MKSIRLPWSSLFHLHIEGPAAGRILSRLRGDSISRDHIASRSMAMDPLAVATRRWPIDPLAASLPPADGAIAAKAAACLPRRDTIVESRRSSNSCPVPRLTNRQTLRKAIISSRAREPGTAATGPRRSISTVLICWQRSDFARFDGDLAWTCDKAWTCE